MSKSLRTILGVVVLIIGLGMIFNNLPFVVKSLHDSDSMSLNGIEKIVVKGSSGDIRIIPSKTSDLKAELSGKSAGLGISNPVVNIIKSGNTITVKVKRSGFQIFSFSKLELDVYISEDYKNDLTLNLSSGRLEMDERFDVNTLDINVSSGNMVLEEIYAEKAKINVSSGNLRINSFTGDIDGEISSGSVEIEYSEFDNDIKFHASSGSVEITLPRGSDFDLDGHKTSGSIKTEFDLSDSSTSDGKIKGTAGSGGNKIEVNVSSGSISIDER